MATPGVILSSTELVVERFSVLTILSLQSLSKEIDMWLKSEETKSHIRTIFLLATRSIFSTILVVIHTCLSL